VIYGSGPFGGGVYGGPGGQAAPSAAAELIGYACELAIDPATYDIAIPFRLVRGADAIAQRIRTRLLFFSGEWFLDKRLGIPYFDQILVKNPRLPVVNEIFRKAVKGVPGVASVSNVSTTITDRLARVGTVDFEATLDDGLVLTAKDEPFIVRDRSAA